METGAYRLDLGKIESLLETRLVGRAQAKNELWDEIESTNTRALELAQSDRQAADGVIVLARRQTAGRGRLGRVWHSPPEAGIYASFLFCPQAADLAGLAAVTLAAGVAASRAIESVTGIAAGLKWVNDLIAGGKKLGGILCEMTTRAGATVLVVGIGINVRHDEASLPDELKGKMEWIERLAGQPVDVNLLVSRLAFELEIAFDQLLEQNKGRSILDQWRQRSVTLGSYVRALSGNQTIEGTACDINENGALLIERDDGTICEVNAGEVSIRTGSGEYC